MEQKAMVKRTDVIVSVGMLVLVLLAFCSCHLSETVLLGGAEYFVTRLLPLCSSRALERQGLSQELGRRRRCRSSGRYRLGWGRRLGRRRSVPSLPVEDHQPDRHSQPHDASEQVGPRKVSAQGP